MWWAFGKCPQTSDYTSQAFRPVNLGNVSWRPEIKLALLAGTGYRLSRCAIRPRCRCLGPWNNSCGFLTSSGWPFGRTGDMASGSVEKKAEKSYLASAVDSLNPWAGSRTATPTPKEANPAPTNPGDHTSSPFYGQPSKKYPPDCPPLKVQWFHAVDVSFRTDQWE